MDVIIEYDKAAGYLKPPPSLEPRLDFNNIRALKKHVTKALSEMFCPQSAIHGWAGLAMDPTTYILLGGIAFAAINNPGPMVVYPQWAAPTTVKMIDATFLREKNYFLSYKSIERACFRMFNANIGAQYKVSNNPTLTGWNSTMSILDILTQLQDSYGKPTMMTLYQNNVTFRATMAPTDSPEMLFYRIEQCQEIQCIGKLPYSDEQIIANAVRTLIQSNIFPLKEFDTWEATA